MFAVVEVVTLPVAIVNVAELAPAGMVSRVVPGFARVG